MSTLTIALICCATVALCVGFLLGRMSRLQAQSDANLLAFLEQTGYSLQAVVDTNSLDIAWQVTDGIVAVGKPSFEIREAITSAAQGVTANG